MDLFRHVIWEVVIELFKIVQVFLLQTTLMPCWKLVVYMLENIFEIYWLNSLLQPRTNIETRIRAGIGKATQSGASSTRTCLVLIWARWSFEPLASPNTIYKYHNLLYFFNIQLIGIGKTCHLERPTTHTAPSKRSIKIQDPCCHWPGPSLGWAEHSAISGF